MTTLRTIRKRLHSIENIQKLTKAMEMVAASRLHYVQIKVKQSRPYAQKVKELLARLQAASTDIVHPLLEKRPVNKIGLVVVGADMGLCGGYNKDVLAAANRFLKQFDRTQVELITIGRKAIDYYHRHPWPIRFHLKEWGEKLEFAHVQKFAHQLIDWLLSGELDEIWFVYTHYINMMKRQVLTEKFLPIEQPKAAEPLTLDYIFESPPQEIYADLLMRYCLAKVQSNLNEAYASELAARIFAMKTATTNAGEMIEKLTLVRNKVRQASITKEMLEITSGAEGLK